MAIKVSVRNNGPDVAYPDGQFIGDNAVTVRDAQGNAMAFAFPGCRLVGEHGDGVLSGETEIEPLLFEGATPNAKVGWMELDDGSGQDPQVVLLDPDLTLSKQ